MFARVAWCQGATPLKHAHLSADLYAGYARVAPDFGAYNSNPAENGFGGGADLHLSRLFAVAAEAHWMHVTYNPEEKSSSVTAFGGPRFFFPAGLHGAIIPFADILGGAATFNFQGNPSPFTSTISPAFAADAGVDVHIFGPLAVRAQGGYVHSNFTAVSSILQPFVHDQHGRLMMEGVWHF
ncbi:MAG: hypothetical protein RB191_11850 [Terriglobia bacterium]|nr:hypothetical protein [Terriglobia bacterium]